MNDNYASDVWTKKLNLARDLMDTPDLPHRYFITVKCFGDHGPDFIEPRVKRYILKLASYSKGHIEPFAGFEADRGFVHGHIMLACENPLLEEDAKGFWKHGPPAHFSHASALDSLEHVARATHYILDHHKSRYYKRFCPNPKKCNRCSQGTTRPE